jgi:metal-responsive CopG/Arc/MetJ family transcriptional regulator
MKIQRNTEVVSVSLSRATAQKLERLVKMRDQSKSSFIASLIDQFGEEDRWQRLYKLGEKTAKKFKITSEEDVDRILHEYS